MNLLELLEQRLQNGVFDSVLIFSMLCHFMLRRLKPENGKRDTKIVFCFCLFLFLVFAVVFHTIKSEDYNVYFPKRKEEL